MTRDWSGRGRWSRVPTCSTTSCGSPGLIGWSGWPRRHGTGHQSWSSRCCRSSTVSSPNSHHPRSTSFSATPTPTPYQGFSTSPPATVPSPNVGSGRGPQRRGSSPLRRRAGAPQRVVRQEGRCRRRHRRSPRFMETPQARDQRRDRTREGARLTPRSPAPEDRERRRQRPLTNPTEAGAVAGGVPKARLTRGGKLGRLAAEQAARNASARLSMIGRSKRAKSILAERATMESAEQLVTVLGGMKGAAMKLGQMLSVLDLDWCRFRIGRGSARNSPRCGITLQRSSSRPCGR